MVGLHPEVVEEGAVEVARRQTEAAGEVRGEDHSLAGLRLGHDLVAGDTQLHRRRDLAGMAEAEEVVFSDL